eukprot:15366569-Ditylum_brightwellii.AAC.1
MLLKKILHLPEKTQFALKLMSCVGSRCTESTLLLFLVEETITNTKNKDMVKRAKRPNQNSNLFLFLCVAVHEGLLKKEGTDYTFAHDQVQYAAYSLIPEDEKHQWHLQIGQSIWNNVSEKDENKIIFLAVDQMNYGMTSIESDDQKSFLAKLNLRAGEKAMSLSTMSSCASYFSTGIKLLGRDHWENDYELSLHLHNYYAEAEHCNGNFDRVREVTTTVLANAKIFYDQLRAYFVLIKTLGAENKVHEAVEMGMKMLAYCGKSFPFELSDKSAIKMTFIEIKTAFENMTNDEFFNLQEMEDTDALIAMNLMGELLLFTYFSNHDTCKCFVSHMIQLSLKYGVCKESSYALSSFANYFFHRGDLKASTLFSNFALSLLDRFDCKEILPRVYLQLYSSILYVREPAKKISEKFMHGYEVGMQTGDITFAMMNARQYCLHGFWCGVKLDLLVKNIEGWEQQMIEYKQELNLNMMSALRCTVFALINYSDDSVQQKRDFLADGTKVLNEHIEKKRHCPASIFCCYLSWVAYIFCNYDIAKDMIETKWELEKNLHRVYYGLGTVYFFDTLTFIALARKTKEDKWIRPAFASFEKAKKDAYSKPHRILMLETEMNVMMGKTKNAINNYNKVIHFARENGNPCEEAIANERACDFCLSQDDVQASHYYGEAYRLYLQWGARGKAAHMKTTYLLSGLFQ